MIKTLTAAIAALSLSACMTTGQQSAVRTIGPDQYTISGLDIFGGNVAQHAASFCNARGQQMRIEGTTTQTGLYSGASYPVMVFRCAPH